MSKKEESESIQDKLLNDSRVSPDVNTSSVNPPTSGQKWWASILLGIVFALVSSPAAYYLTSTASTKLDGVALYNGRGPNLAGLLLHTLIFILIVRIILW